MARSISVKVPTAALIAQIEGKIAEIDEAIANYPAARKEYEESLEHYKASVAEFVGKFIKANTDRIGFDSTSVIRLHSYGNGGRVDITFDADSIPNFPKLPKEPEKPNQHKYYGRDWASQRDLLDKNLKILRMTTQEEVNASTYGAVMEIL